jgi:hypothetical protein
MISRSWPSMKLQGPMGEVAHAEDHGHAALPDSRREVQAALNGRPGAGGRVSRGQSTDNGLTWSREADMVLMACISRHPLFSRASGMAPRGMSPTSPACKSDAASCWRLHSCAAAKQPEQAAQPRESTPWAAGHSHTHDSQRVAGSKTQGRSLFPGWSTFPREPGRRHHRLGRMNEPKRGSRGRIGAGSLGHSSRAVR